MKLSYLGHSCVLIETSSHKILIDPFITGNPVAPLRPDQIEADFVVVTHAHGDHWGNTLEFVERGATLVSTVEVTGYAVRHGANASRMVGMNLGGSVQLPFGKLSWTPALHSSSFPDGSYGGVAAGVVLELEGLRLYHAGDTALFSDMALIGRKGLDLALLPIGDFYTMGPDDALEALGFLKPKAVLPIHHGTFPGIVQDVSSFITRAEARGVKGYPLEPGQTLEL